MKHSRTIVMALVLLLCAAAAASTVSACATTGGAVASDAVRRDSQALVGVWRDTDTDTRFTVQLKDGVAHLVSVIDDDGEVFEIRQQGWEDGRLTWTYYVPSTQYQNTFVITTIGPNMLDSTWTGTSGSGTQALERVE